MSVDNATNQIQSINIEEEKLEDINIAVKNI